MLALGWGLAAAIGAVAGMMIAPIVFLEPNMMIGTLLYGFAGALLGGIDSPAGAVVGGFLVGVLENLIGTYVPFVGTDLKLTRRARADHAGAAAAAQRPVRPAHRAGGSERMAAGRALALRRSRCSCCWPAAPCRSLLSDYRTFQLTLALVYAIAILGLNLLTGYNGQFSLGHGAFYALGAYTAAIMMTHWRARPTTGRCRPRAWSASARASCSASRRCACEGLYLALATFALAVATPQILKSSHLAPLTGGVQGIVILKPDPPFGLPLSQDQWLYYFTLGVAAGAVLAAPGTSCAAAAGARIKAIRDNPIAAEAMGIDQALYKTLTFGVSAFYTGVAGALGAIVIQFVAPDSFTVFLSITLLVGVVVGGLASIPGAIFGGLFVQFIPNLAEQISKAAPWAIYGVFLIAFMYLMPYGVWGLVRTLHERIERIRRRRSA